MSLKLLGWAKNKLFIMIIPFLKPAKSNFSRSGKVVGSAVFWFEVEIITVCVKFHDPPLALDWDVFPRPLKKVACVQAKPLQNLEDLAHTVDKRFVLTFLAKVLISPLESPPTADETLIWLDCLLSWCRLVLKQLANQQKMRAT